jgi:hypothetical protein
VLCETDESGHGSRKWILNFLFDKMAGMTSHAVAEALSEEPYAEKDDI